MDRGISFAAWRQAYERAFAGARRLPLVLRLTPAVLFYVAYKQLRFTPEEARKAQKNEREFERIPPSLGGHGGAGGATGTRAGWRGRLRSAGIGTYELPSGLRQSIEPSSPRCSDHPCSWTSL